MSVLARLAHHAKHRPGEPAFVITVGDTVRTLDYGTLVRRMLSRR
jgi:hypothetical protein